MRRKTYLAPAKVNLHLAVTAVRDNGYHELDTSFVYVDVGDKLHIAAADLLCVTCSEAAFTGEQNLVYQVLQAFRQQHAITTGLSIHIDKHLPAQAGLGGGSSDAATALLVANTYWGIDLKPHQLIDFATPFGADIPCFLFQQASAAMGIGEQLKPYQGSIPQDYIVLAWPGEGVSTAAAFQHFDHQNFYALTDEKGVAKVRARSADEAFDLGFNSLEKSAIALCPSIAKLLAGMRKTTERVWMSGSGSACVAVCHSVKEADALANDLQQQQLATWTHVGHFLPQHPQHFGA